MLNTVIKEIKELFSDKRIWIGIFLVLIIIIIGTSYNREKSDIKTEDLLHLGVINKDDSSYSDLLLSYFNGSETFSSLITVILGEEGEIRKAYQNGELDIYIEIPEGFSQNMIRIEHSPIKVRINIEDTTKAILFQNILLSYEKYIAAVEVNAVGLYEIMELGGMDRKLIEEANTEISLDLIFTALGKEAFFTFREIDTFPATRVDEYYMISILVMALMYAGLYAGFRVLKEASLGTLTRVKTTGLPMLRFLSAKMLILTCILSAFTILSLSILKGRWSIGILFTGISVTLFCVTVSLLLSALFSTVQRYILVGNLLVFYFIVIGGGIIPIQFLPQDIIKLSKFTPNYYILEGIIRLDQGQSGFTYRISLILTVISALSFFLAIFLFERRKVRFVSG